MAAGVAACFGWMVWMVAGIGGRGYSGVNFGSRILRVRGYMEMHSMCNLVDVQMMHGIYIK